MIEKRIYKKKHPKYKTEKERKAAKLEAMHRFLERNRERLKQYYKEKYRKKREAEGFTVKAYNRYNNLAPPMPMDTLLPGIEARLSNLEKENKDILADLEECLKENRELKNLIKWGNRKIF